MQMDEKYANSGKRFTRVIKWLRAKVMQLDYHRGTHAKKEVSKRRSARMAQTDVDEGAAEFIAAYDVLANMARNGKPDDWIPSHIFG
jgi:hypothetical protein